MDGKNMNITLEIIELNRALMEEIAPKEETAQIIILIKTEGNLLSL